MGATAQNRVMMEKRQDSNIVGCRHHAPPLGCAPNNHRLADQLGPVPLLHGRIEGVHVDVEDLS